MREAAARRPVHSPKTTPQMTIEGEEFPEWFNALRSRGICLIESTEDRADTYKVFPLSNDEFNQAREFLLTHFPEVSVSDEAIREKVSPLRQDFEGNCFVLLSVMGSIPTCKHCEREMASMPDASGYYCTKCDRDSRAQSWYDNYRNFNV